MKTSLVVLAALAAAMLFSGVTQDQKQTASAIAPPFTNAARYYSGVTGPGEPVVGDGGGGWRSGRDGVRYKGPHPKPGWHLDWDEKGTTTGAAIKQGLFPAVKPLMELHLRDTIIRLVNGTYYMTGSTGDNIWDRNDGVELWKSTDLKKWDYMGLVWSIERDGTWQKAWQTDKDGHPMRNVWAPEIHYVKGNFYIALCMALDGTSILKSKTGKPEGPYVSPIKPDARMTGGIDANLFQDDDGKVYFTWGRGGTIYQMKDDMSSFEGEGHKISYEKPADGSWDKDEIAFEGASLFKHGGKYYLTGAAFYKDRYSSVAAISDNVYGPYKQWHEAVPSGGGGNYFQDKEGNWWCTVFGNDEQVLWREKPGLVRIEFEKDGRIKIAAHQPDWLMMSKVPK
jgi:xylan 1,4-beta-xylosidase